MANYLYCRVSTDDKGQEFDRQINIGKIYANNNGITYDQTFCEKISGGIKATSRKAFNEMFELLKKGDSVYVSETSRLGRNYIDCFDIIDSITMEKKCNLIFISNGITLEGDEGKLDPYRWLTLSQMMIFDEFQKRQISYMTIKGLQAKKNVGVKLGRKYAFTEAQMKELKLLYEDRSISLQTIADRFNVTLRTVNNYAKTLGLNRYKKGE